jgi:divalent metal cation (Fe/Co/Zn/Cd) transporter
MTDAAETKVAGIHASREIDPSSKRSIFAALIGNVAVAVIKLIAFLISGSASMPVETFHSIIDTFNQGFLLLGMRLSVRPPDKQHPFGYGMDSSSGPSLWAC